MKKQEPQHERTDAALQVRGPDRIEREIAEVEDQIDHDAAAELWGLTDAELEEIRRALELLR